jgi:hypothetical protein
LETVVIDTPKSAAIRFIVVGVIVRRDSKLGDRAWA